MSYLVLPRIDTKPIARELLARFVDFPGILSADVSELIEVKGIKKRAAQFLKVLEAAVFFYFQQKAENDALQFTRVEELLTYVQAAIGGKRNEVLHVIYLDSRNCYLASEDMNEGTVSETVAFPRRIVEGALKYRATSVIIVHNHPGGLPEPSEYDDHMTIQIRTALQTVDINLQEHLIIADGNYYSYRRNGYLD